MDTMNKQTFELTAKELQLLTWLRKARQLNRPAMLLVRVERRGIMTFFEAEPVRHVDRRRHQD